MRSTPPWKPDVRAAALSAPSGSPSPAGGGEELRALISSPVGGGGPAARRFLSTLAAMAASYRIGLASALAAWPVLLGRAIFYGVCLMVLVAFWDKVGAQRLA